MVPATAIPMVMASWVIVASTPLNEAVWLAGTLTLARWASAPNPVPCAAPARASTAVAVQGHDPVLVSQASSPAEALKAANAAAGSRGCQLAGTRVQVREAPANPAA